MDVCVTQGSEGLEVSSYVLHEKSTLEEPAAAGVPVSDKSSGFVNSISSHNLTFGKEVAGNQGSKRQYFKFTLSLGGLDTGKNYAVDFTRAEDTPDGYVKPSCIETSSETTECTADFYLKHGQYISVKGLPDNFTYSLSEENGDYTKTDGISANSATNNGVAHTDSVSSTGPVSTSIRTGFTNTRSGIIPTGLLLTVAPFVIGLFLFGSLFFYVMARRRRKY